MGFQLEIKGDVQLPETPTWDERIEKLYWTDLDSGDVHRYDPADRTEEVWHTGKTIGSAILCDDVHKLLCVLADGIYLLDLESKKLEFLCDPADGDRSLRYSDSRVDAAGRIYTSTVALTYGSDAYTPDQTGSFYCVELDGGIHVIEKAINQYNTITWNIDNTRLYAADTYNECLIAYPYSVDQGVLGQGEVVLDFKESYGMPDGMSVDQEGNLYICHWTGQVSVWDRNLNEKQPIPFPTPQVTCGGFGGADLKDFYVGSGSWGYSLQEKEEHPGCGGFFVMKNPVPGRMYYKYPVRKSI